MSTTATSGALRAVIAEDHYIVIRALGGTFDVRSRPGGGTHLTATLEVAPVPPVLSDGGMREASRAWEMARPDWAASAASCVRSSPGSARPGCG